MYLCTCSVNVIRTSSTRILQNRFLRSVLDFVEGAGVQGLRDLARSTP